MDFFPNFRLKQKNLLHICQLASLAIHTCVLLIIHNPTLTKASFSRENISIQEHKIDTTEVLKTSFSKLVLPHKAEESLAQELAQEDPFSFNPLEYFHQKSPKSYMQTELLASLEVSQVKQLLLKARAIDPFDSSVLPIELTLLHEAIERVPLIPEKKPKKEEPKIVCTEEREDYTPKDFLHVYSVTRQAKEKPPYQHGRSHLIKNDNEKVFPQTIDSNMSPPELPELSAYNTISCHEQFDIDLVYTPSEEGYIFAITLIPKPEIEFEKLKQNIYFLVDKSNAIQNERLKATQDAVLRSLHSISKEDAFNLIAFDSSTTRLSLENLKVNKESIKYVKNFFHGLRLGSLFAAADPFKPLNNLLYERMNPEELSTIILISNGDGLTNKNHGSHFVHQFSSKNQGKYAIFTLAMQHDTNTPLLENLSTLNRGKHVVSPTHRGLKRKLTKLVKSIGYPIAKDIALKPVTPSSQSEIHLLPTEGRMSALYLGQPYVVLGYAKNLDDFILFIQARHKDKWLNIKKKVSFKGAHQGGDDLKREWAFESALDYQDRYFRDGNPDHLMKAEKLLQAY